MNSIIPSVASSATGKKQCYRSLFLGDADFIYYKLSEQDTFSAAYPERNGDNHFKVVNIITDAVRLPDILLRINLVQILVLVDGLNHLSNYT